MSVILFIRSALTIAGFHVARRPLLHLLAGTVLVALFALVAFLFLPPASFPRNSLIEVPESASFGEVAYLLEERGIISSAFTLRVLARLSQSDTSINAGRYLFEEPQCVTKVLSRLAQGEHGLPTVRVTLPEGESVREMGAILATAIAGFDEVAWMREAGPQEGYLFPDTYDFYKDASIEEIMTRMRENFEERTEELQREAVEKNVTWSDIVVMASLIEKEANTETDRHIVSGILWSRIEAGVALQVDAVFPYIRGNPAHVPNGDDPELTSPYNTYLNRGLPPGPIANPGLEALDSALNPTETDYFYYLTGKDGKMYYAESFEGHKRNREQYLD